MTIFDAGNGWREHSGEGPTDYFEKDGWIVMSSRGGKFFAYQDDDEDHMHTFPNKEAAKAFVEKQLAKKSGPKRVSHFARFGDIIKSNPDKLASEYRSLLDHFKVGSAGEFDKLDDLVRYMKVVSALGFFQYSTTFVKHLEYAGVELRDVI